MNRRHLLGGLLATSLLPLKPTLLLATTLPSAKLDHRWDGMALGADASILLQHHDTRFARALLQQAVNEVTRLEAIFSLHDPDSTLYTLNHTGYVAQPPAELLSLLSQSKQIYRLSSGFFDPSVQRQWQHYLNHYNHLPHASHIPPASTFLGVTLAPDRITLPAETSLTLNGIAQGYITDRVCELLLQQGIQRAIVNLGEIRTINIQPRAPAWRVGIQHPHHKHQLLHTLALHNMAIATSESFATTLDPAGTHSHILLPSAPTTTPRWASATVLHPLCSWADALATAFVHMPASQITHIAHRTAAHVLLTNHSGELLSL